MSKVITMIPVRMAATRLPNKPLLDINGKSAIQRVYENVKAVIPGDVVIAAALNEIDPDGSKYDIVVNFQGDNINVDPKVNLPLIEMVEKTGCDIATCGRVMLDEKDINDPNMVKIVMGIKDGETEGRCLYFTRASAPYIRNPEKSMTHNFYHHIGIYVFKASSLQKMVSLPVGGVLEDREALEQLRALEAGMTIRAKVVDNIKLIEEAPADINTPEEYEEAKKWIK